jgi:hypothetical protein
MRLCVQFIAEMWQSRDPRMQLDLMPETKDMKRRETHALISMLIALVVVPLFPLTIIAVWNALKPRRVSTDELNETFSQRNSSGGTSEKLHKGGVQPATKVSSRFEDSLRIEKDASGAFSIQCALPIPSSSFTYCTVESCFWCSARRFSKQLGNVNCNEFRS